jgi:hypothetical protein
MGRLCNGIASVTSQLQSVELGNNSNATNFGQSESTDDGTWNSVLGFNWGYTYLPTYETAKVNWQNGAIPVMPYIFGEGQYENEGLEGTAFTLRKANCGTVCAGGAGIVFGTHQISIFTNFASNLSTPAALNTGYLANFFSNINWWLLVPDFGHSFLTSGWVQSSRICRWTVNLLMDQLLHPGWPQMIMCRPPYQVMDHLE